jgi:hypothetical protein
MRRLTKMFLFSVFSSDFWGKDSGGGEGGDRGPIILSKYYFMRTPRILGEIFISCREVDLEKLGIMTSLRLYVPALKLSGNAGKIHYDSYE